VRHRRRGKGGGTQARMDRSMGMGMSPPADGSEMDFEDDHEGAPVRKGAKHKLRKSMKKIYRHTFESPLSKLGGKKQSKDKSTILAQDQAADYDTAARTQFGLSDREAMSVAIENSIKDAVIQAPDTTAQASSEDEELQLALALSLSEEEAKKQAKEEEDAKKDTNTEEPLIDLLGPNDDSGVFVPSAPSAPSVPYMAGAAAPTPAPYMAQSEPALVYPNPSAGNNADWTMSSKTSFPETLFPTQPMVAPMAAAPMDQTYAGTTMPLDKASTSSWGGGATETSPHNPSPATSYQGFATGPSTQAPASGMTGMYGTAPIEQNHHQSFPSQNFTPTV